jgi:multidrug resistance efflux pump
MDMADRRRCNGSWRPRCCCCCSRQQAKANRAAAAAQQLNAQPQYNRVAELVKRQNFSQATVDQDKANLDAASAGAMQAAAAVTYAAVSKVPDRAKLPTRHALTPTLT